MIPTGQRLADNQIYVGENRFDTPKESFKLLASLIADGAPTTSARLLDIGCATGELIHFLTGCFPGFEFSGVDVSSDLLTKARSMVPQATFSEGRLEDCSSVSPASVDVLTASGVLCCLDDPRPALANMLTWLAPGGLALIFDAFNDDPVDVVMRYRRGDEDGAPWETGWNIFAKASIDRFLARQPTIAGWYYIPFRMPFPLPRRDDPMRTWTIRTECNPHQLVNGASQLVDLSVLRLRKVGPD